MTTSSALSVPGQLGDDVERVEIGVVERVVDVHRQRHRDVLLQRSDDSPVLLDGDDDLRRRGRILRIARTAALDEECAAVAAAEVEEGGDTFIDPELGLLLLKVLSSLAAASAASATPGPFGLPGELGQLGVRVAMAGRLEMCGDFAHRRREDKLATQPALERREVLLFVDDGDDRFAGDRAVGSRRPCLGVADERVGARRQRHRGERLILPAAAERPAFEVDVRQAPLLHRPGRPIGRFLHVGRPGEARTVDVGEVALNLHHLRPLQSFVLDAIHRVEIELLGDRPVCGERQSDQDRHRRRQSKRTVERHETAILQVRAVRVYGITGPPSRALCSAATCLCELLLRF
jgi:hypothetical protein